MSVYSIALPRCPFFFKRRKLYPKAKGLRLLAFIWVPMTGYLSCIAVLTLKL